ncbi:MAG: DUF1579 domain-containing protein [Planctomyces sp.]|nr:DUF1579 domain-containing protein [Planctomyces sp.]
MQCVSRFGAAICLLVLAASTGAQEESPFPGAKPQPEHEWLKKFVGEWDTSAEASTGPGQPPLKCQGTEVVRAIGEFWVVAELQSEMFGTPITAIQSIGYDSKSKAFIGTWLDSSNEHLWKYKGSLDDTGKILTLEAEGPNMLVPGETSLYRDIYEFKSADHMALKSQMQGPDGAWVTFMTGEARRKK